MGETVLNNRYRVDGVFADSGGMGVIYDAVDLRCANNRVLLKTTRYDDGANARHFRYTVDEAVKHVEKLRKILEWEKKILVRFKNERVGNIPSPNDFFYDRTMLLQPRHEGRLGAYELPGELLQNEPYLVMERIYGQPLSSVVEQRDFQEHRELRVLQLAKEVLTIFIRLHKKVQVGPGMGYFIYQDLKPANILVSESNYITLIDLGAVTLKLGEHTTDPTAGCITAGYAAPEAQGGNETRIDQRFDIYTLGVTLWQVLTGLDPQDLGGEFPRIPLKPLREQGLAPDTVRIVARALARDPAKRFSSAAAMRKAVIGAIGDLESGQRRRVH